MSFQNSKANLWEGDLQTLSHYSLGLVHWQQLIIDIQIFQLQMWTRFLNLDWNIRTPPPVDVHTCMGLRPSFNV